MLLGLAALLVSVSGCGARSELVIDSHEVCANGARAGAVGCPSVAFADPVSYPVAAGLEQRPVVADLNGDGALDIAVTASGGTVDSDGNVTSVGGIVTVLLNRGDGVFSDGVPYPTSLPDLGKLAAGDLNGDGFVDLVVGSPYNDGMFASVSVLLNDGHGAFAPGVFYAAGPAPRSVALGDLDGDGLLDIATANMWADSVSILSNLGDGTFAPPVTLGHAGDPTSIAVADLDRDGRLDIAVTRSNPPGLSVFLNAGGGSFAKPIIYASSDSWTDALAVGDVSGDGRPDLVFDNIQSGINVLLNAGGGTFGDAASYSVVDSSLALGDLNGDCRLDIVATGVGAPVVLPNLGGGTFGPAFEPATAHVLKNGAMSVAVGDLDGDGKLDLIVSSSPPGGQPSEVSVLFNRGCGP